MDIQTQELLDRILKDGIEAATSEAAKIKAAAELEAKRIIEAAKKEAAGIREKGKAEADVFQKAGNAALEQASRNLVLAFKGEIQGLLDRLAASDLSKNYNGETLKLILPDLIKNWAAKGSDELTVLLSEEDLAKLKSYFDERLSASLKQGVHLKSDRNLIAGFRIVNKDGSAYYDFSVEAAAELLSAYLNPRLAEILKTAAKSSS
jgi:V/A-type H+-transporting ATPase subunit E